MNHFKEQSENTLVSEDAAMEVLNVETAMETDDMMEMLATLNIEMAKKAAPKKAAKKSKDDDEDDDDDDEDIDDDDDFDEDDDFGKEEDFGYDEDPDFEEFDLPKSKKGKSGSKKEEDEFDEDFGNLDIFNDEFDDDDF